MFVMEPAEERNKDHSHVAHKMKHKPMKFEDSNGIAHYYIRITIIAHTGHAWITVLFINRSLIIIFHTHS